MSMLWRTYSLYKSLCIKCTKLKTQVNNYILPANLALVLLVKMSRKISLLCIIKLFGWKSIKGCCQNQPDKTEKVETSLRSNYHLCPIPMYSSYMTYHHESQYMYNCTWDWYILYWYVLYKNRKFIFFSN